MSKKFIIKEAWLLDEKGDKKLKLTPLEEHEIPSLVEEENIRGGVGNFKESE